jgi:hypothetical protein
MAARRQCRFASLISRTPLARAESLRPLPCSGVPFHVMTLAGIVTIFGAVPAIGGTGNRAIERL